MGTCWAADSWAVNSWQETPPAWADFVPPDPPGPTSTMRMLLGVG